MATHDPEPFYVWSTPETVRSDDPIIHGERWRRALEEIRDADPVDMALDPGWAARVAREALDRA